MKIWSYNEVTGYWHYERSVTADTRDRWLTVFQRDEPKKAFLVSRHKPRGKPAPATD